MLSKQFSTISVVLILVMICATGAMAAPHHSGPSYSRVYHAPDASVYFFPQDMDNYNRWFGFGAWGVLGYRLWGEEFRFSFRGFNLERRKSYTLIYYTETEGEADIICLGSGTTNRRRQLNIRASKNICSLPSTTDSNYFYGAQIMLVPSGNVSCDQGVLTEAGSVENLISYHAIRFNDTDGCPSDEGETPSDSTEEPDGTGEEDQGSEDGSNDEEPPPPAEHPGDSGIFY